MQVLSSEYTGYWTLNEALLVRIVEGELEYSICQNDCLGCLFLTRSVDSAMLSKDMIIHLSWSMVVQISTFYLLSPT